jgi:hypothetical protein
MVISWFGYYRDYHRLDRRQRSTARAIARGEVFSRDRLINRGACGWSGETVAASAIAVATYVIGGSVSLEIKGHADVAASLFALACGFFCMLIFRIYRFQRLVHRMRHISG